MALTLLIVRHGDTFAPGEPPRRIGARTDLPLVASGIAQAERLGAHFAAEGVPVDAAFCSPLARTRETAHAILARQPHELAAQPWQALTEIDHGPDEDRTEPEVAARIGRAAIDRWERDATPPPGWIVDADARRAAWAALYEGGGDNRLLLVTSNGAARFALLAHPALAARAAGMASLRLRTGAWGRIVVERGTPRLDAWDVRP